LDPASPPAWPIWSPAHTATATTNNVFFMFISLSILS